MLALLVAACAPTPPVPPIAVAPRPVDYTCEKQRQAAAELERLGPSSALGEMMGDYGSERRQLRRVHDLPEPNACPK